jgi:hypothetical protein
MDENQLKKFAQTLGVDVSKISTENWKQATSVFSPPASGPQQNAVKDALTNKTTDPYLAEQQKQSAVEESIAQKFAATPDMFARNSKDAAKKNNQLLAGIRESEYGKAGMEDPLADQYKQFLTGSNANRTLADYQRDNAAAQERMATRETAQAERAASLSPSATPDDVKSGDPFKSFRDESGAIEGPKQLKERLVREGGKGYDLREADKAAGGRFNAMFRDNSAVKNAAPEDRMAVMQGLKDARKDALANLVEQRRNDPNSKPIGTVTSIQESNGNVLMQRGENDVRVAKSGVAGAAGGLEETPGQMQLTPAGERAIRDRTQTARVSASELGGSGGGSGNVVAGRNGVAIGGGLSILDQLKANETVPQDFQLTEKQKVGQEALPEAYVKGRDEILSKARGIAQERGQVSSPATRMAMANTSPDRVNAIDNSAISQERAAAVRTDVAKGDAALRSVYSPDQMKSLDKTIAKANKTGGTAFDTGGGNFGVRPTTQRDEELKRRLMQSRG